MRAPSVQREGGVSAGTHRESAARGRAYYSVEPRDPRDAGEVGGWSELQLRTDRRELPPPLAARDLGSQINGQDVGRASAHRRVLFGLPVRLRYVVL